MRTSPRARRPPQGSYRPGSAQALTFANVEHDGFGVAGVDEEAVQIVSSQ